MDKRYFSEKVAKWYRLNKRDLPWRETKDPYKIWLSEIILQQTRVAQGLPYFKNFIDKYPTVLSLARANEQEVLRLWQGLGYYTRARNLHKCAKAVANDFNGIFPTRYADLVRLPGIGPYTAAAIASICFNERVAVVDGNVFRVLSRAFGISSPINSPEGKKEFTELANSLISSRAPGEHNQAIMEFGALFCTPRNPSCNDCSFQNGCIARRQGLQTALPVKLKPKRIRKRYFYYLVFERGRSLMMKKREGKDIWQGLFDFHLVERSRAVKPERLLSEPGVLNGIADDVNVTSVSPPYKHVLSHQTIFTRFIVVKDQRRNATKKSGSYYSLKEIAKLPKPALVNRFLADHYLF